MGSSSNLEARRVVSDHVHVTTRCGSPTGLFATVLALLLLSLKPPPCGETSRKAAYFLLPNLLRLMYPYARYDDVYPPYLPRDQEPPPLGTGQAPLDAPSYLLGWMVKLTPEAEVNIDEYTDFQRVYSADLWIELGYDTDEALRAKGCVHYLCMEPVPNCTANRSIFSTGLLSPKCGKSTRTSLSS